MFTIERITKRVCCREPLQSAQTALKMTSEIAAEQVQPPLRHTPFNLSRHCCLCPKQTCIQLAVVLPPMFCTVVMCTVLAIACQLAKTPEGCTAWCHNESVHTQRVFIYQRVGDARGRGGEGGKGLTLVTPLPGCEHCHSICPRQLSPACLLAACNTDSTWPASFCKPA